MHCWLGNWTMENREKASENRIYKICCIVLCSSLVLRKIFSVSVIISLKVKKQFINKIKCLLLMHQYREGMINLLPPLVSVTLLELPVFEAASTPRTVSRVLMLPDMVPRLY